MPTLSVTTHFTVTIDGDDDHVITGGSTTDADTISVTHYYDQRFSINDATLQELWSNSNALATWDFLWIESNQAVEIQLVAQEGGTVAGSDLENGFIVKVAAGIPLILADDASRHLGDVTGTFNEANYASEIDTWETNWGAAVIDRIECYNGSGSTANVRIFAAT